VSSLLPSTLAQGAVFAEVAAIKAVQLIFQRPPASIGWVTLDASVREVHKASAKATRHPVEAEEGAPSTVSDHVLVDPLSVQIDGVITNTPVEFLAGLFSLGQDPVQAAYEEMLQNLLYGQLVTIVTSLNTYEDMLLENVEVTRDKDKGNALHFSATATQIVQVSLVELALEQKPVTSATSSAGKVAAKAAASVKSASALSILSGVGASVVIP